MDIRSDCFVYVYKKKKEYVFQTTLPIIPNKDDYFEARIQPDIRVKGKVKKVVYYYSIGNRFEPTIFIYLK